MLQGFELLLFSLYHLERARTFFSRAIFSPWLRDAALYSIEDSVERALRSHTHVLVQVCRYVPPAHTVRCSKRRWFKSMLFRKERINKIRLNK